MGVHTVKVRSNHEVRTWLLHSVLFMTLMIIQLIELVKSARASLRESLVRLFG